MLLRPVRVIEWVGGVKLATEAYQRSKANMLITGWWAMMAVETGLVIFLHRSHANELLCSMSISMVTDGGDDTGRTLIFSDFDCAWELHSSAKPCYDGSLFSFTGFGVVGSSAQRKFGLVVASKSAESQVLAVRGSFGFCGLHSESVKEKVWHFEEYAG